MQTSVQPAGAGSGWTSSSNITSDNGVFATANWSRFLSEGVFEPVDTPNLVANTFGFSIGNGNTVRGFTVEVQVKRDATLSGSLSVRLTKSGAGTGSTKSLGSISTTEGTLSGGSSSDLWGGTWSAADLANFGLLIWATPSGGTGSGTVSIDFVRVTVHYDDTTPDGFTFTDVTNQPLSTSVSSNTVTIGGIEAAAPVALTGSGEWRKNGGSWSSSPGTVVLGDQVQVRHTTSGSYGTAVTTTLTIGGVADTFQSTTSAQDTTPDAFTFNSVTGVEPSSQQTSNEITITGINGPAAVSVSGGTYSKNGGAYTSSATTCNSGDKFRVRRNASASFGASVDVALTVGGVTDDFDITTRAADTTPNAFTLTDQSGVAGSTLITSNQVTMAGMDPGQNASVTFPTKTNGTVVAPATNAYEVNINGTGWVNATGTLNIQNGQTLQLRTGSAAGAGVTVTFSVNVGGTLETWTVTTSTGDVTPDPFTFEDEPLAGQSQVVASNEITITGIDAAASVSFSTSGGSAHQYRKFTGGSWGAWTAVGATTVANNEKLQVRLTSGPNLLDTASITMTVGGVADAFNVTSTEPDPTPNQFSFADQSGVDFAQVIESNIVTLTGFNQAAAISIVGGEYSVNGGAYTAASGTVVKGDQVRLRLTSASSYTTTVNAALTVGTVSDTFSVTTRSPDSSSQYVVTFREIAT